MPKVLTTKASIICPHGHRGMSESLSPKWSIDGGDVLCEGDSGKFPTCLPPAVPVPCVGYTLQSMKLNATYIDGRRVMLVTDFNKTHTGLPLVMTEFHTTIDNGTPAPIPTGQPAPTLSPAMLDMVPPAVVAAPPTLAFNSITMQPVTLATTFTLTSANPLRWLLTLINEPLKTHADITNGLPPGLTVVPGGGGWNSSPLTVTVTMTMTAAFMAALTPGKHHFYMTGVSQRGLSGYAELILTVT